MLTDIMLCIRGDTLADCLFIGITGGFLGGTAILVAVTAIRNRLNQDGK